MTAPIFVLQGSAGMKLSLTEDFTDATDSLQVLGIGQSYNAGVLPNEGAYTVPFYFTAESNVSVDLGMLVYGDDEACADTTYWATWKEYHEALAEATTRLNLRGKTCYDVQKAYQLAVLQKEGYNINAISGILTNSQTGEVLTDSTLIARWTDDEGVIQYRLAKTDEKGYYCIEYLPKNVTVSLSSVDVTGLSQTSVQVGDCDVNKVKLTAIPVDSSYQRTVTVNGDLTAYIEYRQSELTNNRSAKMKLVVKNTSNTAVVAPLLAFSAENGSGQSQAILTLNDALAGTSFTTSVLPNGYSSSIQLVAGGETAGTLQSGESVEIPVYWAGWVKPWDSTNFSFNLGLITESETEALDLAELKTAMRPESITDAVWEIVWGRLTADLGTTWGSYTAAMNDVSQLLAQSGQTVRGVSDLMTVLTASATDAFSPLAQLTASTDNSVGGAVFALDFSRSCLGTVTGRYTDSALGYGWDYSWNYALTVDESGNAAFTGPHGSGRTFQPTRTIGGKLQYRAADTDDSASLVRNADNSYTLTETDLSVCQFSAEGKLLSQTDANGNVLSMTYNAQGQLTTVADTLGNSLTIAWNAGGKIASVTDSNGDTTTYQYDESGKFLTQVTWADGRTIGYTYDDFALTSIAFADGTHRYFTYDDAGRAYESHADNNAESVSYVFQNKLSYKVYQGTEYQGTVWLDASGYLYQVLDGSNAVLTTYAYNANGLLTLETQGNGTYTAYTYDVLGQLTSKQTCAANGTELASFDYTYDVLGLISTLTTLDGQWTYGYDKTGQITSSVFVADAGAGLENQSSEFRYDAAGNRVWSKINGVETTYTYNNMNQLLSDGAFTYTYDANGNLLTKTDINSDEVLTFAWNQDGQMVSCVSSTGERWDYEYDALGNRTAITHTDTEGNAERTEYLIDPNTAYGDIAAQFDADGNLVVSYAYGLGLIAQTDSTGADAFYGFDHLGSTAVITDVNGTILNEYAYDQHGNVLAQTGTLETPFQFVGAYGIVSGDHSDLISMRARWYDPASGRFVSEDPIGLDAGDTNLYRYCGNEVIGVIDPSGLYALSRRGRDLMLERKRLLESGDLESLEKARDLNLDISNQTNHDVVRWSFGVSLLSGFTTPVPAPTLLDPEYYYPSIPQNHNRKLDRRNSDTPQSCDPNEINGLVGYDYQTINTGTEDEPFLVITSPNWITGSEEQAFTIYFENKSSATAAAQEVFVTTMLPEELDWSTFELQEICIGNQVFDDMVGYANGVWTVEQTATGNQIQVTCSLDTETGEAKWYLRSWVESTSDHFPLNAYDGFLPPNNKQTHDGEGYVKFSINPNSENLVTNDEIETFATIVFDTNDPIVTNVWRNTIDVTRPEAILKAPVLSESGESVTLNWTHSDVGSGVKICNLYVSYNEGEWELVAENLTDTEYTYQMAKGLGTYSFRVDAVDGVGNVETNQAVEASITTELLSAPVLAVSSAQDRTVALTWTAIENAEGYTLEYSENSDFTSSLTLSVTSNSATISDLTPQTAYYFRAKAVGTGNYIDSAWSESLSVTLPAMYSIVKTKVTVTWEDTTPDVGDHVRYRMVGATRWTLKKLKPGVETFSFSGGANKSYEVEVLRDGNVEDVLHTDVTILAQPKIKSVKTALKDDSFSLEVTNFATTNLKNEAIRLNLVVDKVEYDFALNESKTLANGMTVAFENGFLNFTNATSKTTYKIQVGFTDGVTDSTLSSAASVKTTYAPYLTPTLQSVQSTSNTTIDVAWTPVTGKKTDQPATYYTVQYSISGSNKWKTSTTKAMNTSWTIKSLAASTSYDIRVFATKDRYFLASDYSNTLAATTWLAMPKISSVVSNVVGSAVVKWSSVKNAQQYELYYRLKGADTWESVIVPVSSTRSETYTVPNLTTGASYEFQLQAISAEFESSPLSVVKVLKKIR